MKPDSLLIENKKARMRFTIVEKFSAGIELSGTEAKALRTKHGSLDGARIIVRGGEAYVVGMTIPPYQATNARKDYDPERTRRLLLKKSEIAQMADAESKKGLTIVPICVYNNRYIKVEVAIVRGKGKADRREELKRLEAKKDIARALKRS